MSADFPVHLFEEHSSTLPVWWQQRERPRTVVYLDAHLDLQQTDDTAIQALQRAGNVAQVEALEAPHHLDASRRFAYGIENFLYPAHRLGLLERLVWVAPPHIPRRYSPALLEYVQQMDGISFDELTGFERLGEGALRGRLLGLDVTVCDIDAVRRLELPANYCLDIDIDYFVSVPGDTLWTDPGSLVKRLLSEVGAPRLATVSRAVGSGFMPLHHRFVGDYVAAILSGDAAASEHYRELYQAVVALQSGEADRAAGHCRSALRRRPDCAASTFLLAVATPEREERRSLEACAAELDPAYGFDICREACAFPNRRRPLASDRLRGLEAALARPTSRDDALFARIAVARLHAQAGLPDKALQLLQGLEAAATRNGDIWLAVAAALMTKERFEQAAPLLQRARAFAVTRTSATLYLGDLAMRAGDAARARTLYAEAAERAPAWLLPLERQRLACDMLGDTAGCQALATAINERQRVMANLSEPEQ